VVLDLVGLIVGWAWIANAVVAVIIIVWLPCCSSLSGAGEVT
jgi:hypothetical protein